MGSNPTIHFVVLKRQILLEMHYCQALEQFEVYPTLVLNILMYETSVGLLGVMTNFTDTLVVVFFICSTFVLWLGGYYYFYGYYGLGLHKLYEFIGTIIMNQIGKRGEMYFPILFVLFFFIFVCNVVGLVPINFCITSHIFVTLSLSIAMFVGIVILSVQKQGKEFLWFFVPKNVPQALIPFLTLIEIVSYISRLFSLAIRLFANMVAGHALLHIIGGSLAGGFKMVAKFHLVISCLIVIPFFIFVAIVGLEMGIAFLQAYVFVVLVTVYLNESFGGAH